MTTSQCNQYYSAVVYMLIIYKTIYHSMEHHRNNHLATWGLEPASPVSVVNKYAMLDHHAGDA